MGSRNLINVFLLAPASDNETYLLNLHVSGWTSIPISLEVRTYRVSFSICWRDRSISLNPWYYSLGSLNKISPCYIDRVESCTSYIYDRQNEYDNWIVFDRQYQPEVLSPANPLENLSSLYLLYHNIIIITSEASEPTENLFSVIYTIGGTDVPEISHNQLKGNNKTRETND